MLQFASNHGVICIGIHSNLTQKTT